MNTPYTQVPVSDNIVAEERASNLLSEQEEKLAKKATRMVVLLCFVQLLLALLSLVCGGIIMMCISAIFISIGIVGAAKQRVRLLTVHFVYSLVLYILSLISVVLIILYCDGCKWWIYVSGFFIILFQAVGMRHSRILICLLKKKNGIVCSFGKSKPCVVPEIELANTAQQNDIPMYALPVPAHQVITMPMQPRVPYFPMQPVQYPMMQYPTVIFPNNVQQTQLPQTPFPQTPFALNPIVYKQI